MNVKVIGKFIGLFFICIGYLLIKELSLSNGFIVNTILQGLLGYSLVIAGLGFLFYELVEKNKLLSFIYNKILAIPAFVLAYYIYIIAPILSIVLFLGIYLLPSLLFLKLVEIYPGLSQYSEAIIYILSLLSVLIFAYKSEIVMRISIDNFRPKLFRDYLDRYSKSSFTRIFTYIMMIIIYIIYNYLTFSDINLNIIPSEMLNVIKEVFVTFVAIDTLIQIIAEKKSKSIDDLKGDKENFR